MTKQQTQEDIFESSNTEDEIPEDFIEQENKKNTENKKPENQTKKTLKNF